MSDTHFNSILFRSDGPSPTGEPECFRDLNLDQVVSAITARYGEYDITPFFYQPLDTVEDVQYRQDIMRDVEAGEVLPSIEAFADAMRRVRNQLELEKRVAYNHEKQYHFLTAVTEYCDAVQQLSSALGSAKLASRGLLAFRTYLLEYTRQSPFTTLLTTARNVSDRLAAVRYSLVIKELSITVMSYADEPDYTKIIEAIFDKFRRGAVKDYRASFSEAGLLNHVEAQILDRVARLNPEAFGALENFAESRRDFADAMILRFDREVLFYVAYLRFIEPMRVAGLQFCYPAVSQESKEVRADEAFDIALATKLTKKGCLIVPNDFGLRDPERILVVSGPNQGGKTTFARMFAQLHYLASLGCLVPGSAARLFLCDRILTHFERVEDISNLRGKLEDDLFRIHTVVRQATGKSVVIINEIFASTTLRDSLYLSRQIMAELSQLDALVVCVTFLDELATFDAKTVSVVSEVDPHDPAIRTFRLKRTPANGLAYALAIAEKYRVTYEWLCKRLNHIAGLPSGEVRRRSDRLERTGD